MRNAYKLFFKVVLSIAVLSLFSSVVPSNATQDSTSNAVQDNKGTEFFLLFQNNYTTPNNLDLFITGDVNTSGVVEVPGAGISLPFTVTAGTVTTVSLSTSLHDLGNDTVRSDRGIHVIADDEITVYGLNQLTATTDAFLGLPVDILNRDYLVLSHSGGFSYNQSQFAIIAAYDGTVVTITPSVTSAGRTAGVPYTVNLNKLDTYQLQAPSGSADLTGTEISSNNPIAVFAGNKCDNLPGSPYFACDHNVEQLFPEAAWGTAFLSVPLATRTGGDTFRIIASQDNTTVDINGTAFILNRGEVDDRIITTMSVIISDEPIMVAQYSNSSNFDGVTSDPFMMLLPPYEQFLNSYTFSTPATGFSGNYVNVVVTDSAVGDVTLDGSLVPAASFSPIGVSGYSGAALSLTLGSHSISSSEPIGIHSYGFADYDSYGYPGGLALEFLYPRGDTNPPIVTGSLADCEFNGTAEDSRPSEDVNNNGVLDPGEDLNGNDLIDEDAGVFLVKLYAGSSNLAIDVDYFIPGAPGPINFTVSLIDPDAIGSGNVVITDGAGNTSNIAVNIDCITDRPCGDLDGDGDVDGDDRNILRGALRSTTGDAAFIPEADYNEDGVISFGDYRDWYECYQEYINP